MAVVPPIEVGIRLVVRTQTEADWYAERFAYLMRGQELPEYQNMSDQLGKTMTKYNNLLASPPSWYGTPEREVDEGDLKLSRAIFEALAFTTPEKLSGMIIQLIETGDIFRDPFR